MSSLVQIGGHSARRSEIGVSIRTSVSTLAKAIMGWPVRVHAHRKLLRQMAGMSAYELADIGLTAADLRDTAALPLDAEVGQFLASRVGARRAAGRRCHR